MEAGVVAGADLGQFGLREIHMAQADSFSGRRAMEEERGRCNEVDSAVNSWSQGHKVSDAVCTEMSLVESPQTQHFSSLNTIKNSIQL